MSAEEMTSMSLEEKPESSISKDSRTLILQEKPEQATLDNPDHDHVASAANNAEQTGANAHSRKIFTEKEPLDLVPYIEKYVTVKLERNCFFVGFIHSIDPITHSVILSVPKEGGKYQTVIIPGTSVLDINETPCDSSIIPPKRKPIPSLPSEDNEKRKKKIISWFKENRLPVTEEGENVMFGGITLLPPYEEMDICTTNPLIAFECKKIIERMPADYEPK